MQVFVLVMRFSFESIHHVGYARSIISAIGGRGSKARTDRDAMVRYADEIWRASFFIIVRSMMSANDEDVNVCVSFYFISAS